MTQATPMPDDLWTDVMHRIQQDAGLASFVRSTSAVILMSGDGQNLIGGNATGLAIAGAGFTPLTSRRLAQLAGGLAPMSGVRLERLELAAGAGLAQFTCACRRIRLAGDETALLIAAQDAAATATEDRKTEASKTNDSQAEQTVAGDGHTPKIGHSAAKDAPAVDQPLTAAADAPPEPARPEKVRFLWTMTAEGRFRTLSPEAGEVFGQEALRAMAGQRWQDLCGSVIADAGDTVAAALARGKTWSGLPSLWRVGDGNDAYKVVLSGLPLTDADQILIGWRGFGIVHTGQTVVFPFALVTNPADAASLDRAPDPAPAPAVTPAQTRADLADPISEQRDADRDASDDAGDETTRHASVLAKPDNAMPAAAQLTLATQGNSAALFDQAPVAQDTKAAIDPPQEVVQAPPHRASNIVPIRPQEAPPRLTHSERNAFREIAKALGARIEGDETAVAALPKPARGEQPQMAEARAADDDLSGTGAPEVPDAGRSGAGISGAGFSGDDIIRAAPLQAPPDEVFASLLDKLPIGVLVLKSERMIYANRTLLDLLDHDSIGDLTAVGTSRLFRGAVPSEGGGLFALTRRDGGFEPVDARLSSIAWRGEPATLMSFRRAAEPQVDVPDNARLEALKLDVARAQDQARELTAILDTATDGVATVDERGRILSLNRSAEALFGYDQREVSGENFTLLLAPESHITALDYLEGLKGGGVAALLNDGREVQGRVRQGGRIPLYMTMGRVTEGEHRKYSAVLRDMTAWKRAEADLVDAKRSAEKASAQKSDVLAKISHEIRTPLNAILGFTEVMSEERFGPIGNERYKEYLTDIHQSGGYLISLINDLLDLAKIEAGKMDLTFTGVNLNEIAATAVALLQPEANRQRVVLRTGLQPKLPSVVADERSLRQIAINVLSNAVKFTDAGGQVILSTALGDRGEVILRVRDTGIGMTDKELSLAMEPFRQVASTRRANSSGIGGTGLGLPITKALVEANKGTIQITSAKNEGTLVDITFPPQRVLAS